MGAMSRRLLLELLTRHRGHDPHEAAMTRALEAFVRREPRCFERTLAEGHVTGSAWIVDRSRTHVLLTHHRKLDRWLQLGGHAEGEVDIRAVALREAREESGLESLRLLATGIFDVDVHPIPARGRRPAHLHYDVRFLLEADREEPLVVSAESKALAWVPLAELERYDPDRSLRRMAVKTPPPTAG